MPGLYIHIPFCKSKCAYCDFPSWPGREGDAGRYFSVVLCEAERIGLSSSITYDTVFMGGGTPSLLPAGMLEGLIQELRAVLNIQSAEFTVEANPGTVDREKLASLRRMGADRLSFGVQAAQDSLLKRIGRIHTWEDFTRSVDMAREAGFTNISADMMTGLPGQTVSDAAETAEKLAALGLEHVSCYGLIAEEGTPLARAVQRGDEVTPADDDERMMFHAARRILEGAGIRRYEISNFARPGFECRHNLNYWHNGDWLGLGPGAASHFNGHRRENRADLDAYMAALEAGRLLPADEHDISASEAAFETIMLELRLTEGIDFARFRARHGFDFLSRYREPTDKFILDGLMRRTDTGIALTEKGMDLQNTVLMEYME